MWKKLKTWRHSKTQPIDVQQGYNQWASHYPPTPHNPLMAVEQEAMLGLLPPIAGKICLDLACGSGRYGKLLAEQGAKWVIGTDGTFAMLHQAKQHLPQLPLAHTPFFPLPFPNNTFDLIVCALSVGHESNLTKIMAEIGRVLRDGGIVVYSDFHPFLALQGFQRTFTGTDGTTYSLEHYVHLYSDHLTACTDAGLQITGIVEPIVQKDGDNSVNKMPAVLTIRAKKIA